MYNPVALYTIYALGYAVAFHLPVDAYLIDLLADEDNQ